MINDKAQASQSLDDALEPADTGIFTGKDNPLPEDNEPPATPSADTEEPLPLDHPAHDSVPDEHEAYDEGETDATGATAQDGSRPQKSEVVRDKF
jgi:hypothetical protein